MIIRSTESTARATEEGLSLVVGRLQRPVAAAARHARATSRDERVVAPGGTNERTNERIALPRVLIPAGWSLVFCVFATDARRRSAFRAERTESISRGLFEKFENVSGRFQVREKREKRD